jgi:hypothetical protein
VAVTTKPATGIGEKADDIYDKFDDPPPMKIFAFTAPAGAMRKTQKTAAYMHVSKWSMIKFKRATYHNLEVDNALHPLHHGV